VREAAGQAYVPVIVVSGDVQSRLESRSLADDVTDYFDKALGHRALAAFIRGYVDPQPVPGARVLYVEDSRVVALATKRMLEAHAMTVTHVDSAEAALDFLHEHRQEDDGGADLLLSDVYLKGALSGHELLNQVRKAFGYSKRRLPVVVMTGDDNREHQASLLREGANDLVLKPIEERLLVIKTLFQLRAAKTPERRQFDA
jgi:CheY-like chemotaxis protein